jgi:hypothetical protein
VARLLGLRRPFRLTYYKIVVHLKRAEFGLRPGFYSLDGRIEFRLGQTNTIEGERAVGRSGEEGSGGFFVWPSVQAALAATFSPATRLFEAPRALLRVYSGGVARALKKSCYQDGLSYTQPKHTVSETQRPSVSPHVQSSLPTHPHASNMLPADGRFWADGRFPADGRLPVDDRFSALVDDRCCFPLVTPVSVVASGQSLLALYERFLETTGGEREHHWEGPKLVAGSTEGGEWNWER